VAQQTLDFVIAQQVTGQAEVAKLINSVGALDAEMKKLRAATAGMSGGFNQAAQAIRGNTNVLDAQSKALRNNRQGMQQVGMQVNDFVTSVSTGASPVQAFNQQIGQLGYAMSMMGGVTGRIGAFLAGPWSIAVVGASMALGFLADKFFESGDEAEKASAKTEEYTEISYAQKMASESLIGVTDELNRLSGRYTVTVEQQAAATIEAAKAKIVETQKTLDLAIAQAALNEERLKGYRLTQQIQGVGAGGDGGRAAAGGTGVLAARTESTLEATRARIEGLRKQLGTARGALEFLERNGPKAAGGTDKASSSVRGLGDSARQAATPMQQFLDSINRTDDRLELARQAFAAGTISVQQYREEVERADKAQRNFAKIPDNMLKILQGAGKAISFPEIPQEISVPPALQEILDKNAEIAKSFDAIGNSVAEGFKGMITGAQSFGDAMKGIISSVIDELFRLFVVQQIVGFVSKGLSSLTGIPLPARAMGGSVGQNKPYLVGERGPEIFMPGKSGTVIPTQNTRMGGGGGSTINVSVDARGATSPEMVRQQVQQGILEAAPSIVAAAEQRTISTLRRPRLAGAL
jgi:hypothetical protein